MTKAAETFIDTNVLLAASSVRHPAHRLSLATLEATFSQGRPCLSGQVLREYLVVATRPATANGLGLGMSQALSNLRQFEARCQVLDEGAAVREALQRLLERVPCGGKQVHDANIVATLIGHGLPRLLTLNVADFLRFAEWIEVVAPA